VRDDHFAIIVPEAALIDLGRCVPVTRWPERETVRGKLLPR